MGSCSSDDDSRGKDSAKDPALDEEEGSSGSFDASAMKGGGVCSICLVKYERGDQVVRSSNPVCKHEFHLNCLVEWLASKQVDSCPYCRQPFLQCSVIVGSDSPPNSQAALSTEPSESDETEGEANFDTVANSGDGTGQDRTQEP